MRRIVVHMACVVGGALALGACGLADVRSPVPEFMRASAPDPPPPEPPPDLKQILRDRLESVFTAASCPRHVRVSTPPREPVGTALPACVRSELDSVTVQSLGLQAYPETSR